MSQRKVRRKPQGRVSQKKQPSEDNPLLIAARFLRDDRKHKLPVTDGVCAQKRVQFFKGSDLIEALTTVTIPKATAELAIEGGKANAIAVGNKMISLGLIYRAQEPKKKSKYHENLIEVSPVQKMTEDGLYVWILSASMRKAAMYAVGLVSFALFICLIKVWPLWMKIAVWWISLILLVSILSIIALRLVIWVLFFLVGYRDIWLLPDFLDDHVGVMEAMTPLFGRGHLLEAKLRKKAAKEAKKLGKKVDIQPPNHRFGAANLAGVLFVGLVLCWKLGFFRGENIPDFLAGRDEIWNNYAFLLDENGYTGEGDENTDITPDIPDPAANLEGEEDDEFNMDRMIDEDAVDMDDLMDEEHDTTYDDL